MPTNSQQSVIDSLPKHIQPFVAIQNYSKYTPRDHAIWRFLLHQLEFSLEGIAHKTYFTGLEKTGISNDCIPKIEHINACLNKLGWQAVAVDGFLPPAIFMEFQALKVLAIAVNIRSFEHMLYTPAPDIIHESAGHAPFLIDIDYAEFLQRFGELGMRAIANQHDIDIYEAVRNLSIVKESPSSRDDDISDAQTLVEQLQDKKVAPSEANLLARLHWWTVEYGLVGDVDDYRIYGAGLLSSLSESQDCFDEPQQNSSKSKVIKKRLTIDSVNYAYDITAQQPQLFVTESCRHLSHILEQYSGQMGFQKGGLSSLNKALDAKSIVTTTLNSGLQIAGELANIATDAVDNITYLSTQGPTQLAFQYEQLLGHGIEFHAQGFGSPIGRLIGMERCLSQYSVDELKQHNIQVNQVINLYFLSGVTVTGYLNNIVRRKQKNILFSFTDCTVKDINDGVLFDPDWGVYDMGVGDKIISVSGGSADQNHFPQFQVPEENVEIKTHFSDALIQRFDLYQQLRICRQTTSNPSDLFLTIADSPNTDWLLLFEALELCKIDKRDHTEVAFVLNQKLLSFKGKDQDTDALINGGLDRLGY